MSGFVSIIVSDPRARTERVTMPRETVAHAVARLLGTTPERVTTQRVNDEAVVHVNLDDTNSPLNPSASRLLAAAAHSMDPIAVHGLAVITGSDPERPGRVTSAQLSAVPALIAR